jgi:hypothetical protein
MKYFQKGGAKRFLVIGGPITDISGWTYKRYIDSGVNINNFASMGNHPDADYKGNWNNIDTFERVTDKFDAIIFDAGSESWISNESIKYFAELIYKCLNKNGILVSEEFERTLVEFNIALKESNLEKKALFRISDKPTSTSGTPYYIWGHTDIPLKLTSMENIYLANNPLYKNPIDLTEKRFQKWNAVIRVDTTSDAAFVQKYAIPHLSEDEFNLELITNEEYKKTNEYKLYINIINDTDIKSFNIKDKIQLLLTLTTYKNDFKVIDTLDIYRKLKTDINKVLSI